MWLCIRLEFVPKRRKHAYGRKHGVWAQTCLGREVQTQDGCFACGLCVRFEFVPKRGANVHLGANVRIAANVQAEHNGFL